MNVTAKCAWKFDETRGKVQYNSEKAVQFFVAK